MRTGEPGFHPASEFHHSAGAHGFTAAQHRYALGADPEIFTHVSGSTRGPPEHLRDEAAYDAIRLDVDG